MHPMSASSIRSTPRMPFSQCIRVATHVRFASDGRVNFHRDHWDAAEEPYEKLPLLGSLMRALKRMANR